ncbi:MAG: phosphoribosyl transferase [Clostridia bacterium]|nr:phosphoribosyl transferase [Clostridia bacterium]
MSLTERDLIRVARRINNPRRSYLLVNPLQGKHLAVEPQRALALMRALGAKIREAAPDIKAVVGFAETATAVGAAAASICAPQGVYVHTTRERGPEDACWIDFSEEHSHAQAQRLQAGMLAEVFACGGTLVLVDDEVTTGKTCLNLVKALRRELDVVPDRIILASLISRLGPEDAENMRQAGIECVRLIGPEPADYAALVAEVAVQPARRPPEQMPSVAVLFAKYELIPDPRMGVRTSDYERCIGRFCQRAAGALEAAHRLNAGGRIILLGTEECMYPAIRLGSLLEDRGFSVLTHSTTRSPIGVAPAADYPVQAGFQLTSCYEQGRETYLYNPAPCDTVVVVTDANGNLQAGMEDIVRTYARSGAHSFALLKINRKDV